MSTSILHTSHAEKSWLRKRSGPTFPSHWIKTSIHQIGINVNGARRGGAMVPVWKARRTNVPILPLRSLD